MLLRQVWLLRRLVKRVKEAQVSAYAVPGTATAYGTRILHVYYCHSVRYQPPTQCPVLP